MILETFLRGIPLSLPHEGVIEADMRNCYRDIHQLDGFISFELHIGIETEVD